MAQEFLPLCDVLFNIISLAAYFCDVVFDLVTVYTLYDRDNTVWFSVSLACIMTSLLSCQMLSLRWCLRRSDKPGSHVTSIVLLHCCQAGVLWRYFKLFIPVDLRSVKHEVRDLCVLRMIHAFCESIPMLMIQLYLIWNKEQASDITQLNVVSVVFSLFNVCWALASFNKHVRRRNIHKLVLTWLGVISQFVWRLGTVSSRVVVLTVYATLYGHWTLLVISLHWMCMFLWLISPRNIFHGEKISWLKKCLFSVIVAFVYIFCYINLQEASSRHKIITFYMTMFLENSLLMAVWLGQRPATMWFEIPVVSVAWGGFIIGVVFMVIYYRFFHIRQMKYTNASNESMANFSCAACQSRSCSDHVIRSTSNVFSEASTAETILSHPNVVFKTHLSGDFSNGNCSSNGMVSYVPGVFNCRLNPALMKRKKKKPTTFVPPPVVHISLTGNEKMDHPFWKKSLPKLVSSDQDGSVGSRVNIQQKLQEKKQQQLQELKDIEEEIKQGKIQKPHPMEISEQGTLRQPIPRSKKQPWVKPEPPAPHPQYKMKQRRHRAKTPEILLTPHYLENCRVYYDYKDHRWKYGHIYYHHPSDVSSSNVSGPVKVQDVALPSCDHHVVMYKSYRIPSDLDSQISLPRSYTLPREFKYYRKPRVRKTIRTDHFVTSTNSSDGDVDSGDDDFDSNQHSPVNGLSIPYNWGLNGYRNPAMRNFHETQL